MKFFGKIILLIVVCTVFSVITFAAGQGKLKFDVPTKKEAPAPKKDNTAAKKQAAEAAAKKKAAEESAKKKAAEQAAAKKRQQEEAARKKAAEEAARKAAAEEAARKADEEKARKEEVFKSVEQMPTFPGGDAALMKFLSSHIQYPTMAQENGIQGKVIVQFVVGKDGKVGEVKVARSVDKELDKEAVRVCKSLPKFVPGRQNGQAVSVWYTLPVTFKLQNAN